MTINTLHQDSRYGPPNERFTDLSAPSFGRLDPVAVEEIAYALTVFVAAANLELREETADLSPEAMSSRQACRQSYDALTGNTATLPMAASQKFQPQNTLYGAYKAVWNQYRDDERQGSICARVLGFYSLVEQSRGEAIRQWVEACPESPAAVMLHPAVIVALANIPLRADGRLAPTPFLELVALIAKTDD